VSDSVVLSLFLPIALAIIMAGLGLHLTPSDFRRVAAQPRAVLVALAVQTLLLPPVAFGLAWALRLPAEMAVGLVLLAASPGGVTANIFSHLARGDVALNITLTATNCVLALLTLPLWTGLALGVFLGSGNTVPPPLVKLVEVIVIALVPVAIGMGVRAWRPVLADRLERPVRIASTAVLAILIVIALAGAWQDLVRHLAAVGLACVAFNLISLLSGYFAAKAARLGRPQAIAISFEIAIHNSTLAILISMQVLQNGLFAVAPAVYSVVMYPVAAAFAFWLLRGAGARRGVASAAARD
jgi:bile acid:Na+ symporter, BASS family